MFVFVPISFVLLWLLGELKVLDKKHTILFQVTGKSKTKNQIKLMNIQKESNVELGFYLFCCYDFILLSFVFDRLGGGGGGGYEWLASWFVVGFVFFKNGCAVVLILTQSLVHAPSPTASVA